MFIKKIFFIDNEIEILHLYTELNIATVRIIGSNEEIDIDIDYIKNEPIQERKISLKLLLEMM